MAFAGKDRKAWVLGIARIASRELAEQKHGTTIRLDTAHISAVGAQAGIRLPIHQRLDSFHQNRIAQTAGGTSTPESAESAKTVS